MHTSGNGEGTWELVVRMQELDYGGSAYSGPVIWVEVERERRKEGRVFFFCPTNSFSSSPSSSLSVSVSLYLL
jgi:hypothetical protein